MICDFAETYHVLNYRELSPLLVATLLIGLRDNSRVKMYLADTKLTIDQMILSIVADNLQFISWTKTKDAKHGRYNGKSILKTLNGDNEIGKEDLISFATIEDFEEYMEQFNNG